MNQIKNTVFEKLSQSVSITELLDLDFTIPGYRLIRFLGKGAMGLVFECENIASNARFAVKVLNPEFTQNEKINRQFEQEAKLVARLKHENIISVYDLKQSEGFYYLLMELCPGKSLSKVLKETTLPFSVMLNIVERLFDALQYAHGKRIVHHDVKPGNIMIVEEYRPILCDFGLATIQTDVLSNSLSTKPFGTPQFMSPEKIKGNWTRSNEHSSDLFAMGVLFYYMVTKHYPFLGSNKDELYHQILHSRPVSLSEITPEIPLAIQAIIQKLLEKKPDDRYQSATEVVSDLSNFKNNRPISLFKTSWTYSTIQTFVRHKKRAFVVFFLLSVFLCLAYFLFLKKTMKDSSWVPVPFANVLFSSSGFEDKWDCLDPVFLTRHSVSFWNELFEIQNDYLTCLPKQNFLLIQKSGSLPEDFLFRIKSEEADIPEGKWGIFFGNPESEINSHQGIYFFISSTGVDIHYPRASGPLLAHLEPASPLTGSLTVECLQQFPFLELRINKHPFIKFNLLFFPIHSSRASFGICSLGSNCIFSKPCFFNSDGTRSKTPIDGFLGLLASEDPLEVSRNLLAKEDTLSAVNELENLLDKTSDPVLLSRIFYYLALSYFNQNQYESFFTLLEKIPVSMREHKELAELRLLGNWISYLTTKNENMENCIPLQLDSSDAKRILLLLLLKKFPSEKISELPNPEHHFNEFMKFKNLDHHYLLPLARIIAVKKLEEDTEISRLFIESHRDIFYETDPADSENTLAFWKRITEKFTHEKKYQEAKKNLSESSETISGSKKNKDPRLERFGRMCTFTWRI
jgi:hypothetical protein